MSSGDSTTRGVPGAPPHALPEAPRTFAPAREEEAFSPNEGVSLRSRPPIFFFWPSLLLALVFTGFLGLMEENVAPGARPAAKAPDAGADAAPAEEAARASRWWQQALPRGVSLALLLVVNFAMSVYVCVYLVASVFVPRWRTGLHRWGGQRLFWRFSLFDVGFAGLIVYLIVSPAHGLLALLSFYAFGLMTDQDMFTHPEKLRRGLIWAIVAVLATIVLEVLRGGGDEGVWVADAGPSGVMAAIFFMVWAFNMFVLAFDFNGSSLVALILVFCTLAALILSFQLMFPQMGVWDFVKSLFGGLRHLQINSSFYYAVALVLSMLMAFSGFVGKANFWQIMPMAIVHHEGIVVQRTRHYGALANFHYHVEFPDFFEGLLGAQCGTFILTLPREERPEVIDHVWFARRLARQIQELLAELPTAEEDELPSRT